MRSTDSVSVWTYNDDPGWYRRAGERDMNLADHMLMGQARYLCQQLLILNPAGKFEIRNEHKIVLATFENRPAIETPGGPQPKRRALGNRQA